VATVRSWPFVAREPDRDNVVTLLRSGRSVLLSGAAGVGKSRLAAEVMAQFAADGVVVQRIVASPASAPIPLAPFAGIAGDATGADVVPAVLRALDATGRSGPGDPLLVVDDLHLLDEASAAVTHQLLLHGHVRLILTMRSSATLPAAASRMRHEPRLAETALSPLADDDLTTMVERALSGSLDARSRQLLADVARGNPLYARELIEGSIASGSLTAHAGVYSFRGELAATPLLEELVLARLAPLTGGELEAMELIALGGQLPLRLMQAVVPTDSLEWLERHELIATGTERSEVWVDAAHPLYRELLRARLGALARMRTYRALATADASLSTSATASTRDQRSAAAALRAAVWQVRGGLDGDADEILASARHAVAAGDVGLAGELAIAAFDRKRSAGAAFLASWCLAQEGDHDRSIVLLKEADDVFVTSWDRNAVRLRVAEELWWTGRREQGLEHLGAGSEPDGPWNGLLDAQRGVFCALDGRLDEAVALAMPLTGHEHLWVRFVAAVAVGLAGIYGDRIDDTYTHCGRVVTDAEQADVALLGDANLHVALQLVALLQQDVTAAFEFAQLGYDTGATQPGIQARAWTAMISGQASWTRGEVSLSARYLAEGEQLFAACNIPAFAAWCAAGLARAQEELGAHDEATGTMARLDGYDRRGFHLHESLVMLGRAWHAHGSGDRSGAAEWCTTAIRQATDHGQWSHVAGAWHDTVRLGLHTIVVHEEWQRPAAPLGAARFDLVAAVRADDAAGVEQAGHRLAEIGCLLGAAEAFALASTLHRRANNAKDSLRLDGLAGSTAQRLSSVATTPLLAQRQGSGPLSSRESEIAQHAANGLTNRQIADRLVVSERTVENHLYRVFIKLGIDGRAQLKAALEPHR
jgi:DNA-binding CsgD family transcriptional regulator